jgi:hypothetical protein
MPRRLHCSTIFYEFAFLQFFKSPRQFFFSIHDDWPSPSNGLAEWFPLYEQEADSILCSYPDSITVAEQGTILRFDQLVFNARETTMAMGINVSQFCENALREVPCLDSIM